MRNVVPWYASNAAAVRSCSMGPPFSPPEWGKTATVDQPGRKIEGTEIAQRERCRAMDTSSQQPLPASLLIDAHVHFHACFDRDTFLDAAARNFARGAAELGLDGRPFLGCLMLA